MIQFKFAAIGFILITPSFALPLLINDARSQDLDAREPARRPSINFAKAAKAFAASGCRLPYRSARVAGRDLEVSNDISERDFEELMDLAARDPKSSFKCPPVWPPWHKPHKPSTQSIISKLAIREDDDSLYVREDLSDILDLSERDLEEMEELAARDPSFHSITRILKKNIQKHGPAVRKIKNLVNKVAPIVKKYAPAVYNFVKKFVREDAYDMADLSERDLEAMEELAARYPGWFFPNPLVKPFHMKGKPLVKPFHKKGKPLVKPFQKIENVAKRHAPTVVKPASNVIREEDADIDGLLAREYQVDLLD